MSEVDDFIQEKVQPELHDVVERIRELMREEAPDATELISYGLPMWKLKYPIAWITPSKREITFGFRHGVSFEDPHGLLKGRGKYARHVKMKNVEAINEEALRSYIRQAVELDQV
ncbi:MAG TPA: DUF1801 domain-containing protein [Actinomycetota bacterium]|nr:DUF1801 domain-containing protein [Actinomycetota bacterium]